MSTKAYQPDRQDLLINTSWGIPKEQMSRDQAKAQALVLFMKRWVTKDEKKVLEEQYYAYRSIRSAAFLLLFVAIVSVFLIAGFFVGFFERVNVSIAALIAVSHLVAGIGLLELTRFRGHISM